MKPSDINNNLYDQEPKKALKNITMDLIDIKEFERMEEDLKVITMDLIDTRLKLEELLNE